MTASSYVLLLTILLTEGGTLEAEQETAAPTLQECRLEARRQQQALRSEFVLTARERGMCPFRDVEIRCEKRKESAGR